MLQSIKIIEEYPQKKYVVKNEQLHRICTYINNSIGFSTAEEAWSGKKRKETNQIWN